MGLLNKGRYINDCLIRDHTARLTAHCNGYVNREPALYRPYRRKLATGVAHHHITACYKPK